MGMVISWGNSIQFSKVDSNLPNAENTLSYNIKSGTFWTRNYFQRFDDGDTVTFQINSTTAGGNTPVVTVYVPYALGTLTPDYKGGHTVEGVTYYYWEVEVNMSLYSGYDCFQIGVTQPTVTDVWLSERIISEDLSEDLADGRLLKLEWTNAGNTSILNSYLVYYGYDIEFFMYVEAQIKDSDYDAEDEVFSDISEKKLLESQLFKKRQFKTGLLPEFMIAKIAIAGKCFIFKINDLQFVTDGSPDIEHNGTTFSSMVWDITHIGIIGFNTNNLGVETMAAIEYIKVRNSDAITGSWSFTVPAGYILHMLVAGHGTGSAADYTFKAGYTVGGSEILTDLVTNVPLSGGLNVPFSIHEQKYFATDVTVYITLTGVGAIGKIYANLIYNTAS